MRCTHIYSDQGTNFVGAQRVLITPFKTAAESEKISWPCNPPSAPHFGGTWEAGIESVRTHIYQTIGDKILTFEGLCTILTQIEAILNFRPLYAFSSDPNDFSVLRPGHFLVLQLITIPDPDLSRLQLNRLSQLLQRLVQDFWRR